MHAILVGLLSSLWIFSVWISRVASSVYPNLTRWHIIAPICCILTPRIILLLETISCDVLLLPLRNRVFSMNLINSNACVIISDLINHLIDFLNFLEKLLLFSFQFKHFVIVWVFRNFNLIWFLRILPRVFNIDESIFIERICFFSSIFIVVHFVSRAIIVVIIILKR